MFKGVIAFISNLSSLFLTLIGIEPLWIKTEYSAILQWHFVSVRRISKKKNHNYDKRKIAIVAFRNPTWFGWAVYAAFYLRAQGKRPIIIYSEKELERIFKREPLDFLGLSFKKEFHKITLFEKVNIDVYEDSLTRLKSKELSNHMRLKIKRYAHMVAAYNLKVEEFEADFFVKEYIKEVKKVQQDLSKKFLVGEMILDHLSPYRLICPSGLIGYSIAFLEISKKLKTPSFFIEGWAQRPGHLIWAKNNPALIYDVKGWMNALGGWDEIKNKEYLSFAKFQERINKEEEDNEWLSNFHSVQRSSVSNAFPRSLNDFLRSNKKIFLCATNVVGDSSTLMRDTIFRNQKEWLKEICCFFKDHSEYSLIIRAHPDEIWQKSKIRLGEYAKNVCVGMSNIYVIPGNSDINSYQLFKYVVGGLVWMSNIGLDMLIRNKPVILAARPKYENLGILDPPKTKQEYFNQIVQIANGHTFVAKNKIDLAKYYQLIIFKYMSLEATSKSYNLTDYRIPFQERRKERAIFYGILSGELNEYGRS